MTTAREALAELGGVEGLAQGVGSDVRNGLSKSEADVEYVDRIRQYLFYILFYLFILIVCLSMYCVTMKLHQQSPHC